MSSAPIAYMITFRTYGTWLHGDDRRSVDRRHNTPGAPLLPPSPPRESSERLRLKHPSITLDPAARETVRRTVHQVAMHRGWTIHALNVRSNHVHVVVSADARPERVMNDLKSWSTRRLVEAGLLKRGARAWSYHGSTRYLWNDRQLNEAGRYACEQQGPGLDGTGPGRS